MMQYIQQTVTMNTFNWQTALSVWRVRITGEKKKSNGAKQTF